MKKIVPLLFPVWISPLNDWFFTPIYYIITERTSVKNSGFVYYSSRSWIVKGIQQQYDVNLSFQRSCEISQENPDISREFPGFPGKFSRVNFHQHFWEFPRILGIILEQKQVKNSREFSGIPALPFDPGNSGNSRQFPRIVKNYFNLNYITGSNTVLVFTKSVNSNFRARVLIGSPNSEYPWPFIVLRPEPRWRLVSRHFRYRAINEAVVQRNTRKATNFGWSVFTGR